MYKNTWKKIIDKKFDKCLNGNIKWNVESINLKNR